MDQRQAVFLAVAGAVALGGLFVAYGGPSGVDIPSVGGPGSGDSPSPTAASDPGSSGGDGDGATATPAPNDSDRRYFRFDGETFNRTHFARLARAGNFTTGSNLTVIGPDTHRHYNVTYVVDLRDDTQYSAIDFRYEDDPGDSEPLVRKYGRGDETHINRTQAGRQPACDVYRAPYNDSDRPVNTSLALDVGRIATGVVDGSNWTYTGNATSRGVTLFRFDVNRTRDFGVSTVGGTVTDGSATMVVGSDNIMRYIEYDFTVRADDGTETRYVYRSFVKRIGRTSVAQPDWYPC